jgi:hypothetical protein
MRREPSIYATAAIALAAALVGIALGLFRFQQ